MALLWSVGILNIFNRLHQMPHSNATVAIDAAQKLARLGAYLDAVETARVPCQPSRYQTVAKEALHILKTFAGDPTVLLPVGLSPALQELRANLGLALAINIGMLELPGCVVPFPRAG